MRRNEKIKKEEEKEQKRRRRGEETEGGISWGRARPNSEQIWLIIVLFNPICNGGGVNSTTTTFHFYLFSLKLVLESAPKHLDFS